MRPTILGLLLIFIQHVILEVLLYLGACSALFLVTSHVHLQQEMQQAEPSVDVSMCRWCLVAATENVPETAMLHLHEETRGRTRFL